MEPDLRCYYHPESEATSQCDRCGDYLCDDCVIIHDNPHLCRTCWAEVAPSQREARHLKLLSTFFYIYAVLVAVGAISEASIWLRQLNMLAGIAGSREFDQMPFTEKIHIVRSMASRFLYRLFLVVGSIIAGRSIARRERWMFCILVAAFCCGSMPFGTALGVLTIVVLVRPSVKTVFEANELDRLRSESQSR